MLLLVLIVENIILGGETLRYTYYLLKEIESLDLGYVCFPAAT